MVRGSTPTHRFGLPFETDIISDVIIAYAQRDEVIFKKEKDSCTFEGNNIYVDLKQAETLKLVGDEMLQIQLKVLTNEGKILVSNIITEKVDKLLIEDVI